MTLRGIDTHYCTQGWRRSLLLCLCVAGLARPATAQLLFGIEAGANINHLSFSKDVLSSDNRVGFFLGPKLCATIPAIGLGVDAAALYSRLPVAISSSSATYVADTSTKHLNYLEVPLNLRWDIGIAHFGLFLATGPQFDWFIGNRTLHGIIADRSVVFESNAFSWNVGGGLLLGRHLQLGATYNLPVTKSGTLRNSFNETVDHGNLKNRTWKVRLNVFF